MRGGLLALVAALASCVHATPAPSPIREQVNPSSPSLRSNLSPKSAAVVLHPHQAVKNGNGYIGHFGTDFRVSPDQRVIAVSGGVVADVDERGSQGSIVTILHSFASNPRAIIVVHYVHLTGVRVKVGDAVSRGEPIAGAWSSSDPTWIPHVHLTVGGFGTVETQDPLRLLVGCISETAAQAPVFPVAC